MTLQTKIKVQVQKPSSTESNGYCYNSHVGLSIEMCYHNYEIFILKIVKKFRYKHNIKLKCLTEDDILSMAKIGFMKAYKDYDSSKGAAFATYLTKKVKGEIGHGYIADDGMNPHVGRDKKKDIQFNMLSMDTHVHGNDSEDGFHELIEGGWQDQSVIDTDRVIEMFSEKEMFVLDRVRDGVSKVDIAKEMNVSREYVYQILRKMKKKIEEYYGEE